MKPAMTVNRVTPQHVRVHPAKRAPEMTGSALVTWLQAIAKHEIDGSDGAREVAETVRRAILRSSTLPLGVDKRLTARRVRRAILKASAAMETASATSRAAVTVYLRAMEPAQTAAKVKGFDPTK